MILHEFITKLIADKDKVGNNYDDVFSLTGALIEQLSTNGYECMVCCEIVRCDAPVWSCGNCFHVFHLRCVKRWARSPAAIVEGTTSAKQYNYIGYIYI